MTWARILQNDPGPTQPLRQRIDALFDEQRQSWPTLRDGEAAVEQLRTKRLCSDSDSVVVQLNPSRRPSVLAKTDPASVAARDCFLCPESMPPEERGVAFEDLVVLPNPYPCLPLHSTIASREHCPQQLDGRIDSLLRLAQAIGPDLAATYNGPRCGASAPDHFHFQCVRASGLPVLSQLPPAADRATVASHASFGREMFVFSGRNAGQIGADVERAIGRLRSAATSNEEPMLNLAAHFDDTSFTVLLFPRSTHRPACYFAVGPERLVVSPGVLEMCGLFVVTHPSDFERIDVAAVRAIFQEVCVPASKVV